MLFSTKIFSPLMLLPKTILNPTQVASSKDDEMNHVVAQDMESLPTESVPTADTQPLEGPQGTTTCLVT